MGRKVAVLVHAPLSVVAGALYFLFVLPRWWELSYQIPHTLGTVMRIVCGALIGLLALPVVFTLLRTRKPEYGTPQMALTLRLWSAVFHVLGGVLIMGTAISEIWLSLDDAGQWLFGIYGAAAAIWILGIAAFYLSFVAELPPPPPRPLKTKQPKERKRFRRRKRGEPAETQADEPAEETQEETQEPAETQEDEAAETESGGVPEPTAAEPAEEPAKVTAEEGKPEDPDKRADKGDDEPAKDTVEAERGGLRNRRPSGKTPTSRRRRRLRGGVAVDD